MSVIFYGDRCVLAPNATILLLLLVLWCFMVFFTCSMCATCTTVSICGSLWFGPCSSVHTTPCARSRGYSTLRPSLASVSVHIHVHCWRFRTCCSSFTQHVTVYDAWHVGFIGKSSLQVVFYISVPSLHLHCCNSVLAEPCSRCPVHEIPVHGSVHTYYCPSSSAPLDPLSSSGSLPPLGPL